MKLIDLLESIDKPTTARVVYTVDADVLKKSRIDKTPTPARLQDLRSIVDGVMNLGHDYTKAVTNSLTKSIKKEFPILTNGEAQNAAGHIWETSEHPWAEVDPNYPSGNIYRNKNPHKRQEEAAQLGEYKKYVKIFKNMSSKIKDAGFFNSAGNLVTVSWEEMIAFFKKNPAAETNTKQKDAGVEKEINFRLVSIDNVKYVRVGEKEYDGLTSQDEMLRKLIKS